ncbi:MAG TPA: hypothetical protein VGU61_18755 [Noviherbaspirillum sp.]|jgi:hypothetical protein|uniref:hypothetical protein n=1 Tax=Noviherbaspirillum sp. TaxID=1926288 RepID=UPI002DDDA2E6|nr:hypothetical protein [Noviherbaspirillum sp.]HEV2612310.1 hypothetical protein [Noviherbaspirillum sp.]
MTRFFKTLLLWLLIAALPVQGMAAVVKASCGPQRHDNASAKMLSHSHHHHTHAAHHHDGHGDEHAASHPVTTADDMHAADAMDGATDSEHVHKSASCSACASCCAGAAAPPSMRAWTPPFQHGETVLLLPEVSFTAFFPSGLERPPRPFSA